VARILTLLLATADDEKNLEDGTFLTGNNDDESGLISLNNCARVVLIVLRSERFLMTEDAIIKVFFF